jgi:uncharacterized protein (DUF1501 family)
MLNVLGQDRHRSNTPDARHATRRSLLRAGTLAVGGLTLPDLFQLRAAGAAATSQKHRSVILFWCSGGPGHMETWDPKPQAVSQYRGPFDAISTSLPGVEFGELLPQQAKLMDRLAIVRSVRHGTGDHTKGNHWMLTGYPGPDFNAPDNKVQRRPAMGSAVARLKGAGERGMPAYAAVPHLRGGTDNHFHYAAYLGGGANPFIVNSDPNANSFAVRDLSLARDLTFDRLEHRRQLLATFDELHVQGDRGMADMSEHQQRAFELLTGREVREAFDINAESSQTRDAYGRHTFGQSALLARRLVERGVTFVTVNCEPWDHHGTAGRLKTEEGAKKLIPPFDVALAALIGDLIDRGLYDDTLVVAMGEFGRTPRMNDAGGRDHWGHTFSVLFGCGSMRMGQVIGKSSPRGEYVADRPIDPQDVAATIYHHLGINARNVIFHDGLGRPIYLLDRGEPIAELCSPRVS